MKTVTALLLLVATAHADPQLSSWYTAGSSKYARITETDASLAAGTSETTWTRTSGPNTLAQTLPVYAGPQQIDYSTSWVYVKSPDLATYLMGPWYDNAAKSALFVNLPVNQKLIARFPRSYVIPTTKTGTMGLTVGGVMQDAVGFYMDGVCIFDPMDGFSYSGGTESSPGTGQYHRDAYVNEIPTFDKSYAHQQNQGKYHNHANPYALRYLLGDNVTYNTSTKAYAEGNTTTPTKHSPIIGWMFDGLPLYGPFGYSSAMDSTSAVRRMVGGFVLRDGTTTGVDNITTAGRTVPAWSLRNGGTSVAGPAVSTTYALGRYIEDNAYLGDLQKSPGVYYTLGTDFDLNEYNVRYCVTPEFPNGTWAYFLNITSAGVPQFPYMCNRWYYGTPTGGVVTSIAETVTNYFKGGENLSEKASMGGVNTATGDVTLTWTSVEGGSYKVQASADLSTWSTLATAQSATANSTTTSVIETGGATGNSKRFYRVQRSALATYDGGGGITYAAPTAATSAASALGSSTATLNGTVNANGISTTVTFDYGLTTSYGSSVSATTLSSSTSTAVSASISGLSATTTYHCRVVATNSYGTTYGSDVTFTTSAVGAITAPTATSSAASGIATTSATLNGTVNANNGSTTVTFEYGTTTSYGSTATATPSTLTGSTSTSVAATLSGLTAGTTYYFRVKAVNGGGTTYGAQQTFTTTAASFGTITTVSPSSGTRGSTVTLTVTLGTPNPPPATTPPTATSLTGPSTITPTTTTRDSSSGVITMQITIPAGAATGSYDVNATFGPNTWTKVAGFTVN
ncbi:YHYH protein [Prosthecobacter sp.]|uniref:YHYH protein n=1 Tax=Prosthecobacter sp. TaxID=1965333 RepID=UPI003784CF34